MIFPISLGILLVVLGAQVFLRSFGINWLKISKYFFRAAIVLIFVSLFFQTYVQYQLWLKNDISKYLLPPYTSINYFIFYAFTRFFAPYLTSSIAAILFLLAAKIINKKHEERFFYPEEYYLGALGIFLSGHPGWLFYLVFVILFYLLIHILSLLTSYFLHLTSYKSYILPQRISLYCLWIPMAIFVIIMNNIFLPHLSWWKILMI